jgi:cysteine-rich repeat protein
MIRIGPVSIALFGGLVFSVSFAMLLPSAAQAVCLFKDQNGNCPGGPSRGYIDALTAKGKAIANKDPLAVELRNRQPEGPRRRGFDTGMAAAEGDTLPGPGKQSIHDSLNPAEQEGFDIAVSFSLERNRNADFAARGAAIAKADPKVAKARRVEGDVFYWLGFDIATGIFGDPALGAQGNTATGPGSLEIRDSLSAAGQKGFNASVTFHLSRDYKATKPTTTTTTSAPFCGNGVIDQGEQCDDWNAVSGDGCSLVCTIENPVSMEKVLQRDVHRTRPQLTTSSAHEAEMLSRLSLRPSAWRPSATTRTGYSIWDAFGVVETVQKGLASVGDPTG